MITQLEAPLKRGLTIDGTPYVLTFTPSGFQLAQKGRRKGFVMEWLTFVFGDAALAAALNASVSGARLPEHAKQAAAERSGEARRRR